MKYLVICSFLVALIAANPIDQNVAVTQDTAGNYKIAVNLNEQSRVENGNADGSVSGSYSFVDASGIVHDVQYTAGVDGFRTVGGNALPIAPVPIQDTEEVALARQAHLAHFV